MVLTARVKVRDPGECQPWTLSFGSARGPMPTSQSRRQKPERGFGYGVISQKQGGNTHPESKGMGVLHNEEEHSEEGI